jgi:hypothetical protein
LFLESKQRFSDARPTRSDERRELIVSYCDNVAVDRVTDQAEPARQALFEIVSHPAEGSLRGVNYK